MLLEIVKVVSGCCDKLQFITQKFETFKIYSACASSKLIYEIDAAFGAGNIKGIKEAIKCENLCNLLLQSTAGDKSAEESTPFGDEENTETALQVKHADAICEY